MGGRVTNIDVKEYPEGHKGRKSYVFVRSHGVVAACYVCSVGGVLQIAPEFGGPAIASKHVGGPQVMRDMGEYSSVVDGSRITSRSEHREHVRKHDLVEVGNERIGSVEKAQDSGHRAGYDIKQALQSAKMG